MVDGVRAGRVTTPQIVESAIPDETPCVEVHALVPPNLLQTTDADRTRVLDEALSKLPPAVRKCAHETALGDVLNRVQSGGALAGGEVAGLLFAIKGSSLTRGDLLKLRKHILANLPKDRAGLNKTKAATAQRPTEENIMQLLLPWSADRGTKLLSTSSLSDARATLGELESDKKTALSTLNDNREAITRDRFFDLVKEDAAASLATLEPMIVEQREIAESFEAWPHHRFADQIERFRTEGRAVPLADAGKLRYALQRLSASSSELATLRDALLWDTPQGQWPASARVEPPTTESLFSLMTGIDAPATVAEIDRKIANDEGVDVEALLQVRESLVQAPTDMLRACIDAFHETGRGVDPYHTAVLGHALEKMNLEPAQIERIRAALLERTPKTKRPDAEVRSAIEAADTPAALVKVFTGEVLGRPELPLERNALTKLVAKTQGARGEATQARVRLLAGRSVEQLDVPERTALAKIDRRIDGAGRRLDELKEARAGVNTVRGNRWLDQLEVDVLAGGAVGIPGFFSGSVIGGVQVNAADNKTGAREKGLAAYAMPAFSVGGYGKLDATYTRSEGFGVSGGGGADFFGLWGGPGGRSWGNIFAGGLWIPQVINVGAGYGVKDDQAYGALILSTFWPPFSAAAGRIDTVVRHPGLALGAEKGAELARKLSDSAAVSGAKELFEDIGGWTGRGLQKVFGPVAARVKDSRLESKVRRAAEGLSPADAEIFTQVMRALAVPSEDVSDVRELLPQLQQIAVDNPRHAETCFLLSSACHRLGDGDGTVDAAQRGFEAAAMSGDDKQMQRTRAAYVEIALGHGAYEKVWPVLEDWLAEGTALEPKLHLVQWLAGQDRLQEAKQVAEGLAYEHPRSFDAQRALANVTDAPPVAEVPT